jgi:hypothetical protein
MAKLKHGILGGISGTVGNVVGGRWRGIDYIRTKPASVKNPNTPAQQAQRLKFKLVSRFLKQIQPLIVAGYGNTTGNKTAMNLASSYHLKEAISGTYPNLEIDPSKIRFSSGTLATADQAQADGSVTGVLMLNWNNIIVTGYGASTDGALVLVYNTIKKESFYRMHGASRQDGTISLSIPVEWQGDDMAVFLAFRSEKGGESSNTQYLGTVTATTS